MRLRTRLEQRGVGDGGWGSTISTQVGSLLIASCPQAYCSQGRYGEGEKNPPSFAPTAMCPAVCARTSASGGGGGLVPQAAWAAIAAIDNAGKWGWDCRKGELPPQGFHQGGRLPLKRGMGRNQRA